MDKNIFILGLAICLIGFSQCDTLNQVAQGGSTSSSSSSSSAGGGQSVSSTEISSGIKQALNQGLQASIQQLSAKDGFLGNAAVKILLPPEVQKVESALRSVGLGNLADNLVTNMNRAAEAAVSEAAPIFVNSLSQLTIKDATNILLSGQKDAATSFFKRTTSDQLTEKFSPVVSSNLGKFNVSKYWTDLTSAYNALPMATNKINTDLNAYVTQKAIDGLFVQVASEELKIRENIGGSRSTTLLQKVFGYADKESE
ncbi:DUF4197 domain-containing protein [Olivibacter sitiensis]|uniref:DUF4197 domain-containing protein n=1 Tax=Olivibacter sitiensis TaxID=376470 RepID=UPI00040047E8|nr:DUF4197 domain-containing protein [Olivibacter sitiensis]